MDKKILKRKDFEEKPDDTFNEEYLEKVDNDRRKQRMQINEINEKVSMIDMIQQLQKERVTKDTDGKSQRDATKSATNSHKRKRTNEFQDLWK